MQGSVFIELRAYLPLQGCLEIGFPEVLLRSSLVNEDPPSLTPPYR